MIKKEKGITLVSLIIVIALMLIISSTVGYVSVKRFEVNNIKKMKNDIELLQDKVSTYYLKYGGLPILREEDGKGKLYTYTTLEFERNSGDNENYYILDLEAMGGISLNYGQEGFEQPNTSDDVYIINEATHAIYYVEGVELGGELYHTIGSDIDSTANNEIPPTKPQIKVISGTKNKEGIYTSDVQIEIVPGKDNGSGVVSTTYSVNEEEFTLTSENNIYPITENGTYAINVKTYDESGKASETSETVEMHKLEIGDFIQYNVEYRDVFYNDYEYSSTNGWRLLNYTENANGTLNIDIISTGIPARLHYHYSDNVNNGWWGEETENNPQITNFRNALTDNGTKEFEFYSDDAYYALRACAGLYYNFGDIKFAYSAESRGRNLGYFTEITSNGVEYSRENNSTIEKRGREIFIEEKRKRYSKVRLLTLPELNKLIRTTEDIIDIDCREFFEDFTGLFKLKNLSSAGIGLTTRIYSEELCWLASPYGVDDTYIDSIVSDGKISLGWGGCEYGLRPVVSITGVNLELSSDGTYWVIS